MPASYSEQAFLFGDGDSRRVGIVTRPVDDTTAAARQRSRMGVLVVVGGPQYRVGSHRQFVLLARALARRGYAVMRFDCVGMGDSAGTEAAFTERDADLRAAIDAFVARVPAITGVAVWGLCDAASAALLYAADDARIRQLVLLNPWVRSDAGLARTHLKHYYGSRLADRAFWGDLLRGRVGVWRAARGLVATMVTARRGSASGTTALAFQARMARGWKRFDGDILLICSGDDLTAREFIDHAASDAEWVGLVDQPRVQRCDLVEADHTFSRAEWRDRVAALTADWLDQRTGPPAEGRRHTDGPAKTTGRRVIA